MRPLDFCILSLRHNNRLAQFLVISFFFYRFPFLIVFLRADLRSSEIIHLSDCNLIAASNEFFV